MAEVDKQDRPETLEDIAHGLDTMVEPDNGDERRLSDADFEIAESRK